MISLPINKADSHPFSFTSTNEDPYLEFHIKRYGNPGNFTSKIHELKPGDELILADMFGSIRFTQPGLMIAGGQAITPFIAILRQLKKDNALAGNILLHSLSSREHLFLEEELKSLLKNNYIVSLTREKHPDYHHGRITIEKIKENLPQNKQYYILGPDNFVSEIKSTIYYL